MKHAPDPLAAKCADSERRAREVLGATEAELAAAKADFAKVMHCPVPAFNAEASAAAVSKAEAHDRVHGTKTAEDLARDVEAKRKAAADAVAQRDAEAAGLRKLIEAREIQAAGCRAVLDESVANTTAVLSRVASERLEVVRAAYRKALLQAMDLATDVWAMEALAVDVHRPANRALVTSAAPLTFPALNCIRTDEHHADLRAAGAQLSGQAIVVAQHDAQQLALADVARLRAEITTTAPNEAK